MGINFNVDEAGNIDVVGLVDGRDIAADGDILDDLSIDSVEGPGSAVNNALARFDGTTGKLIQNSIAILTDTGTLTGLTQMNIGGSLDSSAIFSLDSTTQGLLPPRMTTTQRDAIVSPATGLTIYNITALQGQVFDGTNWEAGDGDVQGPASSTDNALARFDAATGKLIQNSLAILDDSGNLSGLDTVTISGQLTTPDTIHIGPDTPINQGNTSISIGNEAGQTSQGATSVAVGTNAASLNQGVAAVAIGPEAGENNQGLNAIAIGCSAGGSSQGEDSIAIGFQAGNIVQAANGIIISSKGGIVASSDVGHIILESSLGSLIYDGTDWAFAGGNLIFADNQLIEMGAGSDLNIFHDGTDSRIINNTGDLIIQNTASPADILLKLGSNGSNTNFEIINNSSAILFAVDGNGDTKALGDFFPTGSIIGAGTNGLLDMRGAQGGNIGGAVSIQGGFGLVTPGSINITAGITNSIGANVSIRGGDGPTGLSGSVLISGGTSGDDNGIGGDVQLSGGEGGVVTGNGGEVRITAGSTNGGSAVPGTVRINAGERIGFQVFGEILLGESFGSVGIGVSSVEASALLELGSTTQGFLMPRMTTAQRDAISSPATGLEVYNTTTNEPEFFDGSSWSGSIVATLAETLALGNVTDGTNIVMSVGDIITSVDDLDILANSPIGIGSGGTLTLKAGDGGTTSGTAGSWFGGGGDAVGAGDNSGGTTILSSGNSTGGNSAGTLSLEAGNGGTTGFGADVRLNSGDGGATSGPAGDVVLTAGDATSGDAGKIILVTGTDAATGARGVATLNGQDISRIPSTIEEIFSASELDDLATAGVITVDGTVLTIDAKLSFTSATRLNVINGGSLILRFSSGLGVAWTYSGTDTFITCVDSSLDIVGGDVIGNSSATLWDLDNSPVVGAEKTTFLDWGSYGTIKNSGFILFSTLGLFDGDGDLKLIDNDTTSIDNIGFGSAAPLSGAILDVSGLGTSFFNINTVNLFSPIGDSLIRIDPLSDSAYTIKGVTATGGGELFDTTGGSTGTFTAVADAAVALTTIDSVTDSSGIARFNFTVGPTLFVNQEVDIVNFVTQTSYNQKGIITATGAGFYEISSIPFVGNDTTGDFSSASVTLTDTSTTLNDGDTLVLDTDFATDYDGGKAVYNQLTNSVQVNATFTSTQTGTWDTSGIDQKDPGVLANDNPGFLESKYIATAFVNDNSTANGAIVNNTFTDMVFGTAGSALVAGSTIERWKLVDELNGTFEYTGNEPFDGSITFDFTVISSGGVVDFRFKWLVDEGGGFVDLADNVEALAAVTSDSISITKTFPLACVKGCQIKPQITRNSGSSGIVTSYATIYATQ